MDVGKFLGAIGLIGTPFVLLFVILVNTGVIKF
jgi:hypothetical protein